VSNVNGILTWHISMVEIIATPFAEDMAGAAAIRAGALTKRQDGFAHRGSILCSARPRINDMAY